MINFNVLGRNLDSSTECRIVPDLDLPPLTPGQCRAARGFLDWTQEELAERATVSRGTIRDFEKGRHALHRSTQTLLVKAFQAAGVAFVSTENGETGVMLNGRAVSAA
jgi:transcriptional regulator with XRE-family HTH domain